MSRNNEIVICKYCKEPEFWGEMRWISGACLCRNCYKADYEKTHKKLYTWDDLDGERPTMADYLKQEEECNDTI